MDTWFTIINPLSGNGKAVKDWSKISALLKGAKIDIESVQTEHFYHAFTLASEAISKGFKKILVLGGDGTLNEVVNAIFKHPTASPSEITMANIPVGTGSDWCRTMKIPRKYTDAIKLIQNNEQIHQDIGLIKYLSNDEEDRYFCNVIGTGFDGYVASQINKQIRDGKKAGAMVYIINLIKSLLSYKASKIKVSAHEEIEHTKIFSLAIGIGMYNGGGMKQVPDANPNDGLLDLTVIRNLPKYKVILNVPGLYSGKFVRNREVMQYRSDHFKVESEDHLTVEIDGETGRETPFEVTILPKALKIVAGINLP